MRILGRSLWMAVACLAPLPAHAQSKGLLPADVAEIRQVNEAVSRALLARDWADAARHYVDDAVLCPANAPVVRGRVAIQTFMATFPPATSFTVTHDAVEGRGDLAYAMGSTQMVLTPPGAPAPVKDVGKWLTIMRRQPDGRWLIAVDIWNSDESAPGAQ